MPIGLEKFRGSEVADPAVSSLVQKEIGWLDVAMDMAL
jgi:hypothetical protein